MRSVLTATAMLMVYQTFAFAEVPIVNYIFPAGGQQGTTVAARIGGCNLHTSPRMLWNGSGVAIGTELKPTEKVWFEGPVIPQPSSQQKEDYPRDYATSLVIAADAPIGRQTWRLSTSQGVTSAWGFVVGAFPEVIEQEIDGTDPAIHVELPVTINGRIFPREDVDSWSFTAKAGQAVTCRVMTSAFGSPLDARMELRGPKGQVLGERIPEGATTPDLHFVTPTDGEYTIRVHDVAFGGLQDHVYRLTLTSGPVLDGIYPAGGRRGLATAFQLVGSNVSNATTTIDLPAEGELVLRLPDAGAFGEVRVELDDYPEFIEAEPNHEPGQPFSVPGILNGRMQAANDVDIWKFEAKKGVEYDFDVRALRLGSSLDAVVEILDSTGKKLAEADDSQGILTDARLRWSAPADGEFRFSIHDRLPSRGDARFVYRVRVLSTDQPEFALTATTDAAIVERGKTANLKITLDRGPGFNQPVELSLEGLPAGVSVSAPPAPLVIAANQREIQLTLKAEADAAIRTQPVKVIGRAKVGDLELVKGLTTAPTNPEPGRIALADGSGSIWTAVGVPTPFKFVGIFETKFIPRGSVYVRKYRLTREGFDGPLEVQLADRQGRHLQGVTATPVIIPPDQSDFEFAVTLPPWMEIGRTCRSTLAVCGTITDPDGTRHEVSYSSNDQNNQMIALVDPGRFAIQLPRTTLMAIPGQRVSLPIRIQRSPGVNGVVTVELVASKPIQGISAKPIEIASDATESTLVIEFANTLSGVGIHPIMIRGSTRDERGLTVSGETPLTIVP